MFILSFDNLFPLNILSVLAMVLSYKIYIPQCKSVPQPDNVNFVNHQLYLDIIQYRVNNQTVVFYLVISSTSSLANRIIFVSIEIMQIRSDHSTLMTHRCYHSHIRRLASSHFHI